MFVEIIYVMSIMLFIAYEMAILADPTKHIMRIKKLQLKRKMTVDDGDKIPKIVADGCIFGLTNIAYATWCFLGVAFGTNWKIYLTFLIISVVSSYVKKLIINKGSTTMLYNWVKFDAAVSLFFIIAIFLEHYGRTFN